MGFFDQINTDENQTGEMKEKHIPVIHVSKMDDKKYKVKVDVGEGQHPNEMQHWIQWVELRINDLYIGRAEFSAKIMDPVVEFIVNFPLDDHGEAGNFQVNYKDAHTVCARARCNVHGLWEAKADFVK